MQMNVSLTDELYEFVQDEVKTGDYNNASEFIRELIRTRKQEKSKADDWKKLNDLLEESRNSGRSPYSLDDIVNQVLQRVEQEQKAVS